MVDVEWKVLKANADAERAQLNKILADIRRTVSDSAWRTSVPANVRVTLSSVEGLSALAESWRNTSSRVSEINGQIVAISQDVTYLHTRIDDPETGLAAISEAQSTLTSRVSTVEGGMEAMASDVTNLNVTIFDPENGFAAYAAATDELRVDVNSVTGKVNASHTLILDANGYITGWVFNNDGTEGVFDIRADRLRITAPGSLNSVELANGILMSVTPTHSHYQGVNFGVGSELITWYGATPSTGPDGASKDNGLFWINNQGQGYFGGGLSNDVVAELPVIEDIVTDVEEIRTDVDDILDAISDIDLELAPEWSAIRAYLKGEMVRYQNSIYLATQDVPAGIVPTNTTYWKKIGEFSSAGEAISYAIEASATAAEGATAVANDLSLLGARNTQGTAFVLDTDTAMVSPTESLGQRLSEISTSFASANARITTEEQSRATADSALASRIDLTQASLQSIRNVENPSFELSTGWDLTFSEANRFRYATGNSRTGNRRLEAMPGANNVSVLNNYEMPVEGGQRIRLSAWVTRNGTGSLPSAARFRLTARQYRDDRSYLAITTAVEDRTSDYAYGYYEGEVTLHPDCRFVRYQITTVGLTSGFWSFDDVAMVPVSRAEQAMASDLSAVSATVSQQGGTLTAHALRMDQQQTAIEGKASTSYVQQVEGKATAADGKAESSLTAVQDLTATVGDQSAQIIQAMEVAAAASASAVSLANAGFEDGTAGWDLSGGAQVIQSNARTGSYALRFQTNGEAVNRQKIAVSGGQKFRVGGWVRYTSSRPNTWLRIAARCYSATGSYLRDKFAHVLQDNLTTSYQRFIATGTFETDVAYIRIVVTTGSSMASGTYLIDDVLYEPVSTTLEEVLARYSLSVNANGDVAGMELMAGGGTSAIRFLANMFSIVDPSGSGGYTHQAGISTWRAGAMMIVLGPGFGQGNQFGLWIGPNLSNVSQCTKANATMYVTVSGDSFFGGSVLVGVLENKNTNNAISNTATVEVGPFATNGKTKEVTYSLSYAMNNSTTSSSPGSGSESWGSATLVLERRIGTGSWTQVATKTIIGTHSWDNLETDPGIYTRLDSYRVSGSDTFTDTNSSSNDFSYRVRITSANGWPHSFGNRSQSLSVRSVEK